MSKETEKQYSVLKKKYKLPDFKEMEAELQLSDSEETNFLLKLIVRRIAEKLDFFAKMIEEILQPDSSLYAMHEIRHFDENEKHRLYKLYKELMELSRNSIEVSLLNKEAAEVEFVLKFFIEWKNLKIELLAYAKKLKEAWQNELDIKDDVGYLG